MRFWLFVRCEKLVTWDFALDEAYMVQVRALKQPDENVQPLPDGMNLSF